MKIKIKDIQAKLKGFLGTYGRMGCLALKGTLKLSGLPSDISDILVDLCDRLTDTAHRTEQQDPVSQADLQRIDRMLDLLRSDLQVLIDVAVPLADKPETMEQVLTHLATENPRVQAGLAQLTEIALGMERLEQGQRETLERVGMIGDAQHEQLELQRQSSRENAVLFRELRQVQLVLRQLILVQFRAAETDLFAGSFKQAQVALESLVREQPELTAPRVVLAAARSGTGDWQGAERALAEARLGRPDDIHLERVHTAVTSYTRTLAPPEPKGKEPQPGDLLGDYRLEQRLGHGGCAQVFKATRDGRAVALKLMHAHLNQGPETVRRFKQEIASLYQIQGRTPHLVEILDFDKDGASGRWFLVMDYIEGCSLEHRLKQKGALPETEIRAIGIALAKGLEQAHRLHIVHADVKPANVILKADGAPVLVDFGIGRNLLGPERERSSADSLTPLFAAPEQLRKGRVGEASDIYSLAATLYYALLYDRAEHRGPDEYSPAYVPAHWRGFFDRGLALRPADRYGAMSEVCAALDESPSVSVIGSGAGTRDRRWSSSRRGGS